VQGHIQMTVENLRKTPQSEVSPKIGNLLTLSPPFQSWQKIGGLEKQKYSGRPSELNLLSTHGFVV
jgi:hypothetical protein